MRKKSTHPRNCRVPPTRITEEEYGQIAANAQRAEKPVCAYVRQMCLHGKITVKHPRADFELFRELQRIGVNLNQLAKVANQTGEMSPSLDTTIHALHTMLVKMLDDAGVS